MPRQKPIEDLCHKFDSQTIARCLWSIKDSTEKEFVAKGASWIDKMIKQKVKEGILEQTRNSSTFKKSEVFKDAYLKHKGDMQLVTAEMDISDRTFFRYKKEFLDEDTVKLIRQTKYTKHTKRTKTTLAL